MSAPQDQRLVRLYTLRELAEAGYGHRVTLTNYIHTGTLPAVKIGGTYKVRESDLHHIVSPVVPRNEEASA